MPIPSVTIYGPLCVVFAFATLQDLTGPWRWLSFLAVCSFSAAALAGRTLATGTASAALLVAGLSVGLFANYRDHLTLLLLLLVLACGYLAAYHPSDAVKLLEDRGIPANFTVIAFWVSGSVSHTRIGELIVTAFSSRPSSVISVMFLIAFLTRTFLARATPERQRSRYSGLLAGALLLYAFLGSLRIDFPQSFGGSWFHVSYYVGPILSHRAGGTLLYNIPTQYGIGPAFFGNLFSFLKPHTSFFLSQAFLLLFVCFCVYLQLRTKIDVKLKLIAATTIFVVAIFNSDPELIGPQGYPSSSVMRFGPSVILLCLSLHAFDTWDRRTTKMELAVAGCAGISFWWSPESGLYTVFILVVLTYVLAKQFSQSHPQIILWINLLLRLLVAPIAMIAFLLAAYVFARSGHLPDFTLLTLYVTEYGSGFGSVDLSRSTAGWLYLILSGGLIADAKRKGHDRYRNAILIAALLAWSSYFFGRAVPDNLIAQIPLLATVLLLSSNSFSLRDSANEDQTQPRLTNIIGLQAGVLFFSSLVLNPQLATTVQEFSIMTTGPTWGGTTIMSEDLNEAFTHIPTSTVDQPIAYIGFAGLLPPFEDKTSSTETWLPVPLTMLEEPIPPDVRTELVRRFARSTRRSGLLVIDASASTEERIKGWIDTLEKTHKCTLLVGRNEVQIHQCDVLPYD